MGPSGNDGYMGATGSAGPAGATGAQGPAGNAGATGANGSVGATGAAGLGATGATGPAGSAGSVGATGSFATAETVYTTWGNTVAAGTYKIDISSGTVHKMGLAGNFVFDGFTNPVTGTSVTLIIRQDATGSRTFSTSTNANTVWAGGVKTLSVTGTSSDIISVLYLGPTGGSTGAYVASMSRGYSS
jgi:hypothetical protein